MSGTTFDRGPARVGWGTRIKSLLLEKVGAALMGVPRHGALTVTFPSG